MITMTFGTTGRSTGKVHLWVDSDQVRPASCAVARREPVERLAEIDAAVGVAVIIATVRGLGVGADRLCTRCVPTYLRDALRPSCATSPDRT